MSTELTTRNAESMLAETAKYTAGIKEYFRSGNIAQLNADEQDFIKAKLCERYNLDPVLRPFELISFAGGQQKFYMTASATNQLANVLGLTREVVQLELDEQRMIAKCTVRVSNPNNRSETCNAFIAISKFAPPKERGGIPTKVLLEGEDLANTLMKLETKAKRKATMSFFGIMDAGTDYEDRPAAPLAAPDVSRPSVIADAHKAAEIVEAKPVLPTEDLNAQAASPTPTEKPAAKRGPKPKAVVVETPNDALEVEASIPTIPEVVVAPVVAAPAPAPVVAPKTVIYQRTLKEHAAGLVNTASKLFGGNSWTQDEIKKSAVKNAIPELDGKYPIFAEGGTEVVLPVFEKAMRDFLVKAGVLKA
jgi:hypothetical protein